MIKIKNNNLTYQGKAKDLLCEMGLFWEILRENPLLWRGLALVVIPALKSSGEPQVATSKQKEYLSKLLALNLDYLDMFDSEKEVENESN